MISELSRERTEVVCYIISGMMSNFRIASRGDIKTRRYKNSVSEAPSKKLHEFYETDL